VKGIRVNLIELIYSISLLLPGKLFYRFDFIREESPGSKGYLTLGNGGHEFGDEFMTDSVTEINRPIWVRVKR